MAPWREALAAYTDVDVALDPQRRRPPRALAHGVPVVALRGRPIGRQSASLLRAARTSGMDHRLDLVCRSPPLRALRDLDRIRRALHAACRLALATSSAAFARRAFRR
jgi:hypothetical protein